jgi:Rrf2 family protein
MTCIAAASATGELVPAERIAASTHVPPAFLSKVLRMLVAAGLLRSSRGHHGGFALTREPGRIRFLDVLEAVDVALDDEQCAFGWGRCNATNPCPLHPTQLELNHALLSWASRHTLADIDYTRCTGPEGPLT